MHFEIIIFCLTQDHLFHLAVLNYLLVLLFCGYFVLFMFQLDKHKKNASVCMIMHACMVYNSYLLCTQYIVCAYNIVYTIPQVCYTLLQECVTHL